MNDGRRLTVSQNGRYLCCADGTPFFWLADTAWELLHALNREEAEHYLRTRRDQGFNVIQTVLLAEKDGLRIPNAYGRLPLRTGANGIPDPVMLDEEKRPGDEYTYWDHADFIVNLAAELGLYVALLPTWGDKINGTVGIGPVIFDVDNAFTYGELLGRRYGRVSHIVWVLGGDRPLCTSRHHAVVNHMAAGLRKGGAVQLITFHPGGDNSSYTYVGEESWLAFNMLQSSHGSVNMPNYKLVEKDYARNPVKPVLDGEPRYEDHPIGFDPKNGYFDAADVRQAAYWAVFSGACGHTYGHHSVWSMNREPCEFYPLVWRDSLGRPGASQMRCLKVLMLSHDFLNSVPDASLLPENYEGANYMPALRGPCYVYVYTPNGLPIRVLMERLPGERTSAFWFDPRTGKSADIGMVDNTGSHTFIPPSAGRGDDWVLLLEKT